MYLKIIILSLIILMLSSCSSQQEHKDVNQGNSSSKKATQQIEHIKSPAGPNSSGSNLRVGANGNSYLTWIESNSDGLTNLYYSILENNQWSTSTKISGGNNWLVNYADFPSMTTLGANSLVAHNLVESGDFSYDINIHLSNDGGSTWKKPIIPHSDNTPTEHGFVSMLPYPDSQFLVIWLDGRKYFEDKENNVVATNKMELRSVLINTKGEISEESVLDESTCSCCQTDAAMTSNGPIVVYRDRTEGEIRDMSYVQLSNGIWSTPKVLASDHWEIKGCPVNGPAIDAKDDLVAVAWYTVVNKISQTKVTFSTNAGESFDRPILVSETNTRGNVDVVLLPDGSAVVSWVEMTTDASTLMARRIHQDGASNVPVIIATASTKSPIYGFPKMIEKEGFLYFAWTEGVKLKGVKTAFLRL